jgi:amino acid transporter
MAAGGRVVSIAIVTVVLAAGTIVALRGLEFGKWIHNAGGMAMLAVFVGLILLPMWAVARHLPVHWDPFGWHLPSHDLRSLRCSGR